MSEQGLMSYLDFDVSVDDRVTAKMYFQGRCLNDVQYEVPLDTTAGEILEEAKFYDLPAGEDYSVYIRNPHSKNDYIFFPTDAKLLDTCRKAGISVLDFPEIEFVIAPEYKGA